MKFLDSCLLHFTLLEHTVRALLRKRLIAVLRNIQIEVNELVKHRNITNYVKAQRVSWFGH
jgi:hypothetical protein